MTTETIPHVSAESPEPTDSIAGGTPPEFPGVPRPPERRLNINHIDLIAFGNPFPEQLCKDLDCSREELARFLASEECRAELALRESVSAFQAKVRAHAHVDRAMATLQQVADNTKNPIAQRLAATELLALAGIHPQKPPTIILHPSAPKPPTTDATRNTGAMALPQQSHASCAVDPPLHPPATQNAVAPQIENPKWKIENRITKFLSLLLTILCFPLATMPLASSPARKAPAMQYRPLGSTAMNVSVIGLGTWQFGGEWGKNFSHSEVTALLSRAKDLGINFLDTAECYGDHLSEKLIGTSLHDLNARNDFLIATKFGHRFLGHLQREEPRSPADVEKQLNDSLAALQTDRIDLYQYHSWPDEQFLNEDVHAVLLKAKAAGKIRHIGNSLAARPKTTRQVADAPKYNVEAIQLIYNRVTRFAEPEIFPLCQKHNLGVLARVPLASGLLSGKYKPGARFPESDVRARQGIELDQRLKEIEAIAQEVPPGIPMSQWALAWCLQNPAVSTVIPGCKNVEQLEQNAQAADLVPPPLTFRQASIEEIYQLRFAILRPGMQPEIHHFPGDQHTPPKTFHVGAFNAAGQNLACLTLTESNWQSRRAYQLRGMAVAPNWRNQNIGAQLLQKSRELVAALPDRASEPWWCNARIEAIGFYQKQNWQIASEEFLIEGVGPHVKMSRDWG